MRFHIDFSLLLNIFSSKENAVTTAQNVAFVAKLISFLKYCLIEIVIGFVLGCLFAYYIVGSKDILRLLVGDNIWYQLFRGLMLKDDQRKLVDVILVDILSNTKETTVLYSGLLVKFDLVPNTRDLAYITMKSAGRRDLRQGSSKALHTQSAQVSTSYVNNNGPFIEIPGKYFTLLGREIMNINITYLKIETDATGTKKFTVVS